MLIYGSYLSKKENLPKMAMNVTLVDTAVAFIAGLVVMPAMFVAFHAMLATFFSSWVLRFRTSCYGCYQLAPDLGALYR